MVVVMGEAGQAGHAASVVVLEPFEEFAQFLPALLILLQPLTLLLGRHSDDDKHFTQSETARGNKDE